MNCLCVCVGGRMEVGDAEPVHGGKWCSLKSPSCPAILQGDFMNVDCALFVVFALCTSSVAPF